VAALEGLDAVGGAREQPRDGPVELGLAHEEDGGDRLERPPQRLLGPHDELPRARRGAW